MTVGGQSTTSRRSLAFGITDATSVSYEAGGFLLERSMMSGLYTESHDGTGGTTNFRYFSGTNNPDDVDGLSVGSNDDLADDTWFHLESNWTYKQATDVFDIELIVKNADQSSTIRTVTIGTDIANPFGANPTLYSFFGGRDSYDSGIAGVDNFSSPVPEPSSAALLGLTGIGLALLRRRRSA